MLKKIYLIALLLICQPSYAADWIKVNYNDTSEYYLDVQSVSYDKKIAKFWTKTIFLEDQVLAGYGKYNISLTLNKINCANNTNAIIKSIFYKSSDLILSYDTPAREINFSEIVPESYGESARMSVCIVQKK